MLSLTEMMQITGWTEERLRDEYYFEQSDQAFSDYDPSDDTPDCTPKDLEPF